MAVAPTTMSPEDMRKCNAIAQVELGVPDASDVKVKEELMKCSGLGDQPCKIE